MHVRLYKLTIVGPFRQQNIYFCYQTLSFPMNQDIETQITTKLTKLTLSICLGIQWLFEKFEFLTKIFYRGQFGQCFNHLVVHCFIGTVMPYSAQKWCKVRIVPLWMKRQNRLFGLKEIIGDKWIAQKFILIWYQKINQFFSFMPSSKLLAVMTW